MSEQYGKGSLAGMFMNKNKAEVSEQQINSYMNTQKDNMYMNRMQNQPGLIDVSGTFTGGILGGIAKRTAFRNTVISEANYMKFMAKIAKEQSEGNFVPAINTLISKSLREQLSSASRFGNTVSNGSIKQQAPSTLDKAIKRTKYFLNDNRAKIGMPLGWGADIYYNDNK